MGLFPPLRVTMTRSSYCVKPSLSTTGDELDCEKKQAASVQHPRSLGAACFYPYGARQALWAVF